MTTTQTNQFVPLVSAAPSAERQDFQITVIPQKDQAQPFQSLEKTMPGTGDWKRTCEPQVSLQRDGGRITSIRIQCSCGQTMDLACVYDESSKSS